MQISLKSLFLAFKNVLTIFRKWLLACFHIAIILCLLASILGFFGHYSYFCDLMSTLRIQHFYFGLIALPIAIIITTINKKHLWTLFVVIALIAISTLELYPYTGFNITHNSKKNASIKILLSNVLFTNKRYDLVLDMIEKEEPDIIVLQEVNDFWDKKFSELKDTYPYGKYYPEERNYFGLSVYSKIPLEAIKLHNYTCVAYIMPYISFQINIDGKTISFYTTHTLPPSNKNHHKLRNKHLKHIAEWVNASNTPCVVIGDLNITPFSVYFKDFTKETDLVSSRIGKGFNPTWCTYFPNFMLVPIDFILHSKDLEALSIKTDYYVGSDHLPVIVELGI